MMAPAFRRSPSRWRFLLLLLIVLGPAACIVVPIPHSGDVGQPVNLDPAAAQTSTREEVLARWGEPFMAVESERVVAYTWIHKGWIICVAVYGGGGDCGFIKSTHLTLFQFDEDGHVRRSEESSYYGTGVPLVQPVKEWANREAIKSGVTTRDEVIARLGEPNTIWEDQRVLAYTEFPDKQMLLVQLDEAGRVARAERVERPSGTSFGDFLGAWAKGEAHAGS